MKAKNRQAVTMLAVLTVVAVAFFIWATRQGDRSGASSSGLGETTTLTAEDGQAGAPTQTPAVARPPAPPDAATPPTTPPPMDSAPPRRAEAVAALQHGLELAEAGELLAARAELSKAIFSGLLDDAQADQARDAAAKIADATIFAPNFYDGDPYAFQYTFQPGEILTKVERKLNLHVPAQLILRVNHIGSARSIRAGQTLKMVQGPFHAIVRKSTFTIDLYLHRSDLPPVFIRRLPVGLGADGSTPVGAWKVGKGRKMLNATWFPPPSSDIRTPLRPGDPDYPLGKAGYWIGLIGTDPNTASYDGYGLHGTNDPGSIGTAASLGCIRLADSDIEFVFSLLYEEWSTVQVTP